MDVYDMLNDQGIGAYELLQDFSYTLKELYEIRELVDELIATKESQIALEVERENDENTRLGKTY